MRKIMFGVGVAVLTAVAVMFSTPAAAGVSKECWDHWDEETSSYVRLWASGAGHYKHVNDLQLGFYETSEECAALVLP